MKKYFSRNFDWCLNLANAFALAVVFAFIVYPFFFPEIVSVQAKKEINSLSKGNEVWIRLYDVYGNDVTNKLKPAGDGWVKKNGWWLSGGGGPLVGKLSYPASYHLKFFSHPWSGVAEISTGNGSKHWEVDLFSQENNSKEVRLINSGVSKTGISFAVVLGGLFFLILEYWRNKKFIDLAGGVDGSPRRLRSVLEVLILAGFLSIVWPAEPSQGFWRAGEYVAAFFIQLALSTLLFSFTIIFSCLKRNFSFKPAIKNDCFIASCVVFVSGLFWLAIFFPGLMSEDSINAFSQLVENTRVLDFPAAHTIYMDFLRDGKTIWPISVFQIFSLSAVFFFFSREFINVGLSRFGVYASALLISTMPIVMVNVITMWRDVPYSLAVFFLSGLMFSFAVRGDDALRSWSSKILFALCLSVVFLFRFNGVFVAIGTLLVLFLARPTLRKSVLMVSFAVLLIVFSVKKIIYPAYDVMSPGYTNFGVAHHVAAHIKSKTEMRSEDLKFLENVRPIAGDSWGYDCSAANGVVWAKDYNASYAEKNVLEFISVWLRLAMASPLVELKHAICAADLVWHVPGLYGRYVFAVEYTEGEYRYIKPNPYVQEQSFVHPDLLQRLLRGLYELDAPVMVRPAFFLYVLIWASIVSYLSAPGRQWVYLLIPAMLSSLSVALMTVAQDVRYQYPVFLISLFLIPILLTLTHGEKRVCSAVSSSVNRA